MNRRSFTKKFIECAAATPLYIQLVQGRTTNTATEPISDFIWRGSTVLAKVGLLPAFSSIMEFSPQPKDQAINKQTPMIRLVQESERECTLYFLRLRNVGEAQVVMGSYISVPLPPSLTLQEAADLAALGIDFRKRAQPLANMFSASTPECTLLFRPIIQYDFSKIGNLAAAHKTEVNSPRNCLEYSDGGEYKFVIEWSNKPHEILEQFQSRLITAMAEAMARFS